MTGWWRSTTAGSCANRSRLDWRSGWTASACIRTATAIPRGTSRECDARRSGWNDHPSFFFLDTLEDYHAILANAGVHLPLWPTEFGWPAAEGIRSLDLPPDFPYPYAAWVTEQEQADYLVGASQLMVERPWVGPFFIWNLNVSVTWGAERPESLFSVLKPRGLTARLILRCG